MPNPAIRPGSDEEWAELMHQLRLQPKAQPNPFFYARLQARLAGGSPAESHWLPGWARRPAYLLLLSMLVLAVSGDGSALPPAAAASYQADLPALPLPH